jgi:hypothetical protein
MKLLQLLLNCAKGFYVGLGFFPPFLEAWKSAFSECIFLILTTIFCVVCSIHVPMLLAEVAMLFKANFLGDSGRRLSTMSLVSFLALAVSFPVGLCIGLLLCTYTLYSLENKRSECMSTGVIPFLRRLKWSCHVSRHILRT